MGRGMMGRQQSGPQADQGWYCPWCGAQMESEMMHRHGHGMGSGMMGRGGMMEQGRGMGPQYGPQYGGQQQGQPITQDQAKFLLENYLRSTKNPNLKLGKISEDKNHFEAEITTKDGSLVDKIMVDKYTGWFRSAY